MAPTPKGTAKHCSGVSMKVRQWILTWCHSWTIADGRRAWKTNHWKWIWRTMLASGVRWGNTKVQSHTACIMAISKGEWHPTCSPAATRSFAPSFLPQDLSQPSGATCLIEKKPGEIRVDLMCMIQMMNLELQANNRR
ncbi:unnamed protein product [Cylindrotheca closterium]|uniref:Uncharacterized protein n=1 Tax=Cylindrotheca closterium TaxID=2856 RepID=A0AAD2FP85_9STRA|nr:unnamed protein product [Cylindrotheca closterium]